MYRLFYILVIPVLSYATPSWFFNMKHNGNDIIGYGANHSIDKAKQSALMDITNSISVSVESNVDISTGDDNGKAQSSSFLDLHTKSKAKLSGVEFIKVEHEDEIWYVAAKYDNSPIELKFKKRIQNVTKDEKQNNYIKNTPLILSLNEEITHKLDYELLRKNNLWQINYKDIILPLNQKNFYRLFSNQNSKNISIKPNQDIYDNNDNMFFNILHKKPGYISILYVEHNGKVGVLLANYKSNKSFSYPNEQSEASFKVSNPYNKTVKELYISIYSNKIINLSEFEGVSNSYLDESNYNFDKLIKFLDDKNFATYKIKLRY